jgi:hypothetical protein
MSATKSGWRPIESAPKDGTWVILATPVCVQSGYWGPSYFDYSPMWLTYAHRSDYAPVHGEPTHWQPLPDPPEPDHG